MHWLGMLGIGATLLLAVSYAALAPLPSLPNEAQAEGYRFGSFLGSMALPALVAYLAAGRRKVRNPNRFAGVFCAVAVVVIGLNAAGSISSGGFRSPETTQQKTQRLMREAAGLQPVRTSIFGEDELDAALRDLFKEVIANNKEYNAAVDKLDISATASLITPQSFADPASAAEGLKQLHAAYDLDAQQEQRMQQTLENCRRRFANISGLDRAALLEGFRIGLEKGMPVRQHAVSSEKAWVQSVDDLFDYARSQHSYLKLSGGLLVIAKEPVRQEFNSRIDNMNARREEFLKAKKALENFQQQILQNAGVTPEQTGLTK